jgi:hypothetical protein
MDMLFCFLSLIFDRLLGWLMLLGRASSSKTKTAVGILTGRTKRGRR